MYNPEKNAKFLLGLFIVFDTGGSTHILSWENNALKKKEIDNILFHSVGVYYDKPQISLTKIINKTV